jgi:hypothetical protein
MMTRRKWLACSLISSMHGQGPARRLDRENLLLYRESDGRVRPVRNTRQWLQRRAEIVRGMQRVMGPLPGAEKRCALEMRVQEEMDAGSHVRRLITYSSEPGSRVLAYLLVPKEALKRGSKPARAALCLHPTDDRVGHRVVVEAGFRANRQYAAELAERGWVSLAPAYPLLAQYQPDLQALGYQSGTMKAVWDNIRGLDLLEGLPYVRKAGFAAIGHSLGGHNSLYTAVFDARIQAVVSSCGFDSYLDYMGGDIRGWTSTRYMPKLLEYRDRLDEIPFDFHEILGAIAPRGCFVSAPLRDDNFRWQSVERVCRAARQVYRLYEKESNLVVHHPDAGHDFPDEIRALAYEAMEAALR